MLNGNIDELKKMLYEAILSLKDEKECEEFFTDLCTDKEIEQMAQRIKAAELLQEGKTYACISEELDISSATLARVSRALQYGKGYKRIIQPDNKK